MKQIRYQFGFTLVELMISVGIIGLLAGVAVPVYTGYIDTTKNATASQNAETLAGFEDTYFYENDEYLIGSYTPPGANGLAGLGWAPTGDDNQFSYDVAATPCGDNTKCYTVTVTYLNNPLISATVTRP